LDGRVIFVNRWLRETFGRRYVGNFGFNSNYSPSFYPVNKLELIVLKRILRDPELIGRFDAEDGSQIRVPPQYSAQAMNYALVYEKRTGKEVEVILDEYANTLRSA